MKKLNKKTKKTLKIVGIVALVLLLLFGLMFFIKVPVTTEVITGSTGSSGGGGGGSSTTTTTEDVPFINIFSGWFGFTPIDIPEVPSIIIPNIFPTSKATGSSCTANSECTSGYCDLVTYATGGRCAESPVEDIRSIPLTFECTRDTDCNKCANPDYDTCVSNKCECVAPTTASCSDSDRYTPARSLFATDINPFTTGTAVNDSTSRGGETDYCGRGNLIEFYCEDSKITSKIIDCTVYGSEYFCYDGACTYLA